MIIHGDALDVLATLDAASVDAVVTDPPYALGFMGKAWDTHTPAGFQSWCQAWATECLRVLKPGGHLVAFGGTRTWHRLAVGVEDAGFEMRDSIAWLYGSGFPKSKASLKPAHEPIVLARKGTGVLNIDACRVQGMPSAGGSRRNTALGVMNDDGWQPQAGECDRSGNRWPANVLLDGDMADALDEQSGVSTSPTGMVTGTRSSGGIMNGTGVRKVSLSGHGDTGGASRFFPVFRYQAKAPTRERPKIDGLAHPTVKPLELIRWLVRLVTPPDGIVLDPFAGSGTTGEACLLEGFEYVLIEQEADYLPLIVQRLAKYDDTLLGVTA